MSGPDRRRALLLLVLTMASACADAIAYLGLGRVFPANMTGNTVLLGIGLADGDVGEVLRSASALGAFLFGALLVGTALRVHPAERLWGLVLAAETAVIGGMCAWWLALGVAEPVGSARYGLIALAATAMGAQSGIVRGLDVPVTTTYITGTWTALSTGVPALVRGRASRRDRRAHAEQALVVAVYLATAVGAGYTYTRTGAAATALPLVLLAGAAAARLSARAPARRR